MRRHLLLILTALSVMSFAWPANAQMSQSKCISVEGDGSQTLRTWGKGRNRADAIEQAKKNAVYDVLFNGVSQGNEGYNLRPLITEVNARERYREYFDIFFKDRGVYLKYVSMADRRLLSNQKKKSSAQVSYEITVRVLIPELRQRLKDDGIL